MKKEKLNFKLKRPMMFYQEGRGVIHSSRVRIVFPDGKTIFQATDSGTFGDVAWPVSCFVIKQFGNPMCGTDKSKIIVGNQKEAIEKMRDFDRYNFWKPAKFLGYL